MAKYVWATGRDGHCSRCGRKFNLNKLYTYLGVVACGQCCAIWDFELQCLVMEAEFKKVEKRIEG